MSRSRKKPTTTTNPTPETKGVTAPPPHPPATPAIPWLWPLLVALPVLVAAAVWVQYRSSGAGKPLEKPNAPRAGEQNEARNKAHPLTEALRGMAEQRQLPGRPAWRPEPWSPAGPADEVIDRFVKLLRSGDQKAAALLLGGEPVSEERVIDEKDYDAATTNAYLRSPKLQVTAIARGEPDDQGGQRPTTGRYTLVCQGVVQVQGVRQRDAKGVERSPVNEVITNPELIVDVKDGKLHGVRSASAR